MHPANFSFSDKITAELVMSIGKDNFLSHLDTALSTVLPVDHITLFVFDTLFVPHFVAGTSRKENGLTSRLSRLYEKSFYYSHDPTLQSIGRQDNTAPLLQQLHAKDIQNPSYRKIIYEDNNLLDRLSLIDHDQQKWFVLNLYREGERGYFNKENIRRLQKESVLIAAFVKRHLSSVQFHQWNARTIPPIAKLENLVASINDRLSKREIEVCARVMQGLTREGVSIDLNIKPPTVATLMRRAYQKLGISSLNELFALCLARQSLSSNAMTDRE